MASKAAKRREPRTAPKKSAKSSPSPSKLDAIVTALRASKGATLAQLVVLTGWQPHSVRGAMSGSLKKQRKLKITSSKAEGADRIYRIEAGK